MFWTEKFATDTAYAGLKSWKGYYATATNGLAADKAVDLKKANDQIYEASRQFAATVSVAEGLRVAYATNSAVKAQIPAIMATVSAQASNLVWLVNYWKGS
jgi:hypothetical protein